MYICTEVNAHEVKRCFIQVLFSHDVPNTMQACRKSCVWDVGRFHPTASDAVSTQSTLGIRNGPAAESLCTTCLHSVYLGRENAGQYGTIPHADPCLSRYHVDQSVRRTHSSSTFSRTTTV